MYFLEANGWRDLRRHTRDIRGCGLPDLRRIFEGLRSTATSIPTESTSMAGGSGSSRSALDADTRTASPRSWPSRSMLIPGPRRWSKCFTLSPGSAK